MHANNDAISGRPGLRQSGRDDGATRKKVCLDKRHVGTAVIVGHELLTQTIDGNNSTLWEHACAQGRSQGFPTAQIKYDDASIRACMPDCIPHGTDALDDSPGLGALLADLAVGQQHVEVTVGVGNHVAVLRRLEELVHIGVVVGVGGVVETCALCNALDVGLVFEGDKTQIAECWSSIAMNWREGGGGGGGGVGGGWGGWGGGGWGSLLF